jgi:hypothetical protein
MTFGNGSEKGSGKRGWIGGRSIAVKICPEAEKERESLCRKLLEYFDEHGVIPDFSIRKREVRGESKG